MTEKLYGTVLIKAAQLLDCLADGKPQSVQSLAKETAITAPTVSKILSTLEYLSYVSKSSRSKKYFLGPEFLKFSAVKTDTTNFVEVTRPFLEGLQEKIDETIHLAVPQGNKVVYVNKLEPKNQGIYMTSKIGLSRELYSSGIGKAVLATYSKEQLNAYLDEAELTSFTPYTITDKAELLSEIEKERQLGYAIDDEEQEVGGYCVAMAIKKHDLVVGTMSVSLPKFRLTPAYKNQIITEMKQTKKAIEHALEG